MPPYGGRPVARLGGEGGGEGGEAGVQGVVATPKVVVWEVLKQLKRAYVLYDTLNPKK